VAPSIPVAAPRRSGRPGAGYAPPEPLEALHILDLLELTGSQTQAARALALHQSTVCRSAALMGQQFRLQPEPGASPCRYGSNESLHLLRMAYRAHRLMDGQLRIAADPLHQPLLAGIDTVQPVPPRFRPAEAWAQLLDQALIDGVILSSWCQPGDGVRPGAVQPPPCWPELITVPLGTLPLRLVCADAGGSPQPRRVLVPSPAVAPRLHGVLVAHGFRPESQPASCQELPACLKRLRQRGLAMPLAPDLLEPGWLADQGLVLHCEPPPLLETLWLLLPQGRIGTSSVARRLLAGLRERLREAGGDPALPRCPQSP
jgi:DNA-binding transcriptional LysR family regulator